MWIRMTVRMINVLQKERREKEVGRLLFEGAGVESK